MRCGCRTRRPGSGATGSLTEASSLSSAFVSVPSGITTSSRARIATPVAGHVVTLEATSSGVTPWLAESQHSNSS